MEKRNISVISLPIIWGSFEDVCKTFLICRKRFNHLIFGKHFGAWSFNITLAVFLLLLSYS